MPAPAADTAPGPLAVPAAVVPAGAPAVDVAPSRRLGFMAWFSVLWPTVLGLAAVLAPVLPLDDPDTSHLGIVRKPPIQPGHLLGGDGSGRDMLARVIWGARTSLLISVTAVGIGFLVGGLLGL